MDNVYLPLLSQLSYSTVDSAARTREEEGGGQESVPKRKISHFPHCKDDLFNGMSGGEGKGNFLCHGKRPSKQEIGKRDPHLR